MAVRTAQEIIGSVRDIFGEQSSDGYLSLLEDITDSVGGSDMSGFVPKEEYDKVVGEREAAVAGEKAMRDRYINRFYDGYSAPNDKGFIISGASQDSVEGKEYADDYEELFE